MKQTKNQKQENGFSNIYRSNENKIIAGVCGGLGEYFKIDPIIFRIIFVALFVYGGSGLLVYLLLWLVIPKNKGDIMQDNVEEIKDKANKFADKVKSIDKSERRSIVGIIIILFGLMLLLNNLGIIVFAHVWRFWPIFLILLGISIISKE